MQRVNAVTDQHKNLFNNRLVENVSTFQLIAIIRDKCFPLVFIDGICQLSLFSIAFSEWIPVYHAYWISFFHNPNIRTPFQFSVPLNAVAVFFYVCVLKRMKASIVLRKSNRLKKIFFGIFLNECGFYQMMGNKGKIFLWKPLFFGIGSPFFLPVGNVETMWSDATELRLFSSFFHLFQRPKLQLFLSDIY